MRDTPVQPMHASAEKCREPSRRRAGSSTRGPVAVDPRARRVLALQRTAGNSAVARSLAGSAERRLQRQSWESESTSGSESGSSGSESGSSSASESDPGTGGGPGGAPASSPANCKVDVRAKKIRGLSALPVWHLFIIYTDASGDEYFYRGGPDNRCGGTPPYYAIAGDTGRYLPGTVDWTPGAPSETVATGPAACGKDSCLASETSRIHGTCTPYRPLGPNSNTFARTLLSKCGLPQKKPVWIAPGWGDPDL